MPIKCAYDSCNSLSPSFNIKGCRGKFCKTHRTSEMVNVRKKLCDYEGCESTPIFNIKGGKGLFCRTHKTAEMIDVVNKRCEYKDCESTNPRFGIKGEKGRFCKFHKSDEMTDVVNKTCEYDGCNFRPGFDIKGGKGRFCKSHKTAEMIDVVNKRCEYDGCDSLNPIFDIKGGKGRFCKSHKTAVMINVIHKRCEYEGCLLINPVFDIKGGKGRFCKSHKTAEMIDVKSKRCEYEGCDSIPVFDIKGGNGRFCKSHKTAEMIDVKTKRCEYDGCDSLNPVFDIKGGKGKFCGAHKTNEMVDVKHARCKYEGCNINVSYGKPGYKQTHCFKHRQPGMIRWSNKKCISCKDLATWGLNNIPIHCEKHKTTDEKNIIEQPCKSCGLLYVLDNNNTCENCNPINFLNARLAKQNALMEYLDARKLNGYSTDKIIENGLCGKERPDRIYDFNDKIVILECDENQHRERECSCEQARMVNIGQAFGGLPVYFIRWNPDSYTSENNKKSFEKINIRHKLVGDLIDDIRQNKCILPNALVSVMYLYYDGWNSLIDEKWHIITKYNIK